MSAFGLLCPVEREPELDAAIARARALADEHNASATCTVVSIFALKGRIAETDEEATRAIVDEVKGLLDAMSNGIDRLQPTAIRAAADQARALGAMLAPEQAEKVEGAIVAARRAARLIVKRVEKEGEDAAVVLADIQRGAIEKARFSFLDLDVAPAASEPALPSIDVQRVASIDFDHAPAALASEVA